MWKDFKNFLLKQNALSLAIAFVIGAALNKVVQAIVNDFIMPIVGFAVPSGEWEKFTWTVGSVTFGIGDFLSAIVQFVIIGFVAWRLSKLIPPAPETPTKECPFCRSKVDTRATRCPQCTSQLA